MEMLDMKCAEYGYIIAASNNETLIRKSLGILQEDGVYAFFLYLASQKENDFMSNAYKLLKATKPLKDAFKDESDVLEAVRTNLAYKLDELLFAKELLERTLVYARYHAKALEKQESRENVKPEIVTKGKGK